MASESFYWYDYETFGIHPALDRPAQFAGLRTDLDLNPIGDELLIYNQLTDDYLPDPEAALITSIGPSIVQQQGLPEYQFIARIKSQLSQAGTCNIGYNSIRFDDEFTRNTLFRNFYDAYEHEWRSGNSRWDLLDIVRLTRALRPEGIQWPVNPDGSASNKLEDITRQNGLSHEQAHDALSDVLATIAVAKLIKQHQPKLFQYAFSHRDKASVAAALNVRDKNPVLHVSGMIPGIYGHTAMVMPLAPHPTNKNGVIVLDLREDPALLERMPPEEIAKRIFTPAQDLKKNESRLAIKTIHINRAPVVVPLTTLDSDSAARLKIDKENSLAHRDKVLDYHDLPERLILAMQPATLPGVSNVDSSLYSGGFFSSADKRRFSAIRAASGPELSTFNETFDDARIEEMLFRYRGRNFPDTLDDGDKSRWAEHCVAALTSTDQLENSRLEIYSSKLSSEQWPAHQQTLREDLIRYGKYLVKKWGLPDPF